MSTATLQIRVENNLKEQATALFDRLGLDLPTAIRIFLKKSVSENGVPFEIKEKPCVSASGLEPHYRHSKLTDEMLAERLKGYPPLEESDFPSLAAEDYGTYLKSRSGQLPKGLEQWLSIMSFNAK